MMSRTAAIASGPESLQPLWRSPPSVPTQAAPLAPASASLNHPRRDRPGAVRREAVTVATATAIDTAVTIMAAGAAASSRLGSRGITAGGIATMTEAIATAGIAATTATDLSVGVIDRRFTPCGRSPPAPSRRGRHRSGRPPARRPPHGPPPRPAGVDDGERPVRADGVARPARAVRPTAWSMPSCGRVRPPPSADDREAERAGVDARRRCRPAPRATGAHDGRARRDARSGPLHQVGRAAERRDHAGEALRGRAARRAPPRAAPRPASRSGARPPRTSISAPSASVTAWKRGSRRAPGQVVDRVGDLERVAGGARPAAASMSVISADGRQAGARSRPRRCCSASAARVVQRRHEGAGAGLHVHDEAVEPGGELLRQDRGGDQVDRFDRRR